MSDLAVTEELPASPEPAAADAPERPRPTISRAEWGLILVLAAVQFTHIIDFMIIMPLGPRYMVELGINTQQFGLLAGSYGFSACVASLLAAAVLDRLDRKTALLGLYTGFALSTLFCAVAPNFELLLAARTMAGAFGGVAAVAVLAIIGDVFADYRRGTATGAVMSAFSVASILGVPAALELAKWFGTSAPFWALAGLSSLVLPLAMFYLPSLRGHLHGLHQPILAGYWALARDRNHQYALALMAAMVLGAFTLFVHLPAYLTANCGWSDTHLQLLYMVGGPFTLVMVNVAGRLADRFGKLKMFRILALSTLVPAALVTNLPPVPPWVGLLVTTLLMITTSGRYVPGMALITASSTARVRGSFLSLVTAVQHFVSGAAALLAGLLVSQRPDGRLTGYSLVGLVAMAFIVASVVIAGRLRPAEEGAPAA